MDNTVLMEIEKLRRASLATLRAKHLELFEEPTRSTHRGQLFRRIAWRLQVLAEGDLSERARSRAQLIARDADLRVLAPAGFLRWGEQRMEAAPADRERLPRDSRLARPGALLSRDWKGKTILVEVLSEGFRCDDRQYRSLSAIALAVTGTRWNGLAFFRLTGKKKRGARHGK